VNPERYRRVKELFMQASDLDDAGRAQLLDRECADDPEIRDEVLALLEHHETRTILAAPENRPLPDVDTPSKDHSGGKFARDVGLAAQKHVSQILKNPVRRIVALLLVLLLLAGVGIWMYQGMKTSLEQILATKLQTICDADVTALELWLEESKSTAQMWARQPDVRKAIAELVEIGHTHNAPREELLKSTALANLRRELDATAGDDGSVEYAVIDRTGLVLAAEDDGHVGLRLKAGGVAVVAAVFEGTTTITKPFPKGSFAANQEIRFDAPVVWVNAPTTDDRGEIIAALGFGMRADDQFTRILSVAQMGESGETYAFDEQGYLLSESRFNDQLRKIGAIPDRPDSRSIFAVQVRDPGGNLTVGFRPTKELAERPLTELAARAIASRTRENESQQNGVLITPYRDYRGVEVIGAWKWLPEYGFGVATEVDSQEAFAPLRYPIVAFWIRFGLLSAALCALLLAAARIVLLQDKVGAMQQLGRYTLLEKIGEGGIGQVYLARHAMLRRPTAVKLLKADQVTELSIRRFEREVQLASQLTHPNTIDIYDFGRTSDGVFYYAMEYLPGISLAQLVKLEGPVPAARVIYILKQVCGSLKEAHDVGLIHRDIKPHNIMLGERGGEADFVKVLDFGLVKNVGGDAQSQVTAAAVIAGTPLYMAPECIRDPLNIDARSDLYALGAVGYNLIAGAELFNCQSQMDVLHHVMNVEPVPLSDRMTREVPVELESLIKNCLAKDAAERPASAQAVLDSLNAVTGIEPWTPDDAQNWWTKNESRLGHSATAASLQATANQAAETIDEPGHQTAAPAKGSRAGSRDGIS
jgi:tRNA A-37 threonylcarbamoyl transferase component Bud32